MSMTPEISRLIERMDETEPVSDAEILRVEAEMQRKLPSDFKEFLRVAGHYDDFAGQHYLAIWRPEEIIAYNRANQVDDYAPGLLLFGCDGGGESFAFDYRHDPPAVVMVPSIGLELASTVPISDSFSGFIRRLDDPKSLFDEVA